MLLDIFPLGYTQKYINDSSIFLADEKYLVGSMLLIMHAKYIIFTGFLVRSNKKNCAFTNHTALVE